MSDFMKLVDDINNLKYEEKIVAFVDVLGFKNLIANGSELELKACLTELLLPSKTIADEIDCFTFSDCFYMCTDIGNAIKLLEALMLLQRRMIDTSPLKINARNCGSTYNHIFLIRGGVTVGNVMTSRDLNICSGSAVVEAYELESCCAENPRIVISNVAMDRCFASTGMNQYIKLDDDGYYFTDFKRYWTENENVNFNKFRDSIDDIIEKYEPKGSESAYKKYKWLKKYLFE